MPSITDTPTSVVRKDRSVAAEWEVGSSTGDFGNEGVKVVRLYTAHNKSGRYLYASLSSFHRHVETHTLPDGTEFGMVVEEHGSLLTGSIRVQPTKRIDRYSKAVHEAYFVESLAYARVADHESADKIAALFDLEAVDA